MSATTTAIKDRQVGSRKFKEIEPLDEHDAQLVNAARRCLITALDHSRAEKIALRVIDSEHHDEMPIIELPPAAIRVVAKMLEMLGERKPLVVVPRDHQLTTQDAANMLNVSRPFVVKEIEEGRLPYHMVGSHRRIAYLDLVKYREKMKSSREKALQDLAQRHSDIQPSPDGN